MADTVSGAVARLSFCPGGGGPLYVYLRGGECFPVQTSGPGAPDELTLDGHAEHIDALLAKLIRTPCSVEAELDAERYGAASSARFKSLEG